MIIIALAVLIIITFVLLKYGNLENFDKDTREFVQIGAPKYDLRGRRLNIMPLPDCHFNQFTCYNNTTFH